MISTFSRSKQLENEGLRNHLINLKKKDNQPLANIKARLPELERLLEEISFHWGYEDPIYRFYYQSFKVIQVRSVTFFELN